MPSTETSSSMPQVIQAAPVDDGVKLLATVWDANARADRAANLKGHAETRDAIRDQTKSIVSTIGLGIFVGAAIIVLVVLLLGETRGVDTDKVTDNTVKVIEALPVPTAAAPPGGEED